MAPTRMPTGAPSPRLRSGPNADQAPSLLLLLMLLRQKAAAPEASQQLISDIATVVGGNRVWAAIWRRRFRRKGVRVLRELFSGSEEFVEGPCVVSAILQDSAGGGC